MTWAVQGDNTQPRLSRVRAAAFLMAKNDNRFYYFKRQRKICKSDSRIVRFQKISDGGKSIAGNQLVFAGYLLR